MPEITARLSTALADRYRIERHLGAGGMATVYLARDLKHHRKVAVKVLRPELAAAASPPRQFRQPKVLGEELFHAHDAIPNGGTVSTKAVIFIGVFYIVYETALAQLVHPFYPHL